MVSHQFLVADQLIVDVIIGTDFLAAHHVSIGVANNRAFRPTTGELTTNVIVSTAQPNHASLTQPLPATCGSYAIESQTDPLEYRSVPRYRNNNAGVELPRHPSLYSGLISSYRHLFNLVPGSTSVAEHQIRTSGTPVRVPPRCIPERYRAEVVSQLQEMLDRGIIEPSQSPWMAPAVYTTKRPGEVRICVDYRELNKRTLKDAYPLPMPDDIFEKVASASVFSALNMHCGFWQILVKPSPLPRAPLQPFPIGKPWERVAVDILEVPMSQLGNRYLLVLQDWFPKWDEAVPTKNQMAATISSVLVEIFSRMGIPDILHTDQGANFESNLLRS
ncbi:hypothetical protein D918_09388, partial [Trichuris suis]